MLDCYPISFSNSYTPPKSLVKYQFLKWKMKNHIYTHPYIYPLDTVLGGTMLDKVLRVCRSFNFVCLGTETRLHPQGKGGPKVLSPISFTCFSPIFGISSIIWQMSQTDLFLNANRHATGCLWRISGSELSVTDIRQTSDIRHQTTDRRTRKLEGSLRNRPFGQLLSSSEITRREVVGRNEAVLWHETTSTRPSCSLSLQRFPLNTDNTAQLKIITL